MTPCIAIFKNFAILLPDKKTVPLIGITQTATSKRKGMLNLLVKINLVLLAILFLNGISNSYQQKSNSPAQDAMQAFANHPLPSKIFKKNF